MRDSGSRRNSARPAAKHDAVEAAGNSAEPSAALGSASRTPVPPANCWDITRLPICAADDLRLSQARALAGHIGGNKSRYVRLVECRGDSDCEIVVFDVEAEVPQRPKHDIRSIERIAVLYVRGTDRPVEVWALRESFPADIPHVNLRDYEYPRSLCLFDVPFRDLAARWTPARFIVLVREWLRLSARGELHADDQPLERLFGDVEGQLILPREIAYAENGNVATLTLDTRPDVNGETMFVISKGDGEPGAPIALVLMLNPRVHGVIRQTPHTLAELHHMLTSDGNDLIAQLRSVLKPWMSKPERLGVLCFLVLRIPVKRTAEGRVEATETLAFLLSHSVAQLGISLGLWERSDAGYGALIWPEPHHDGRDVTVALTAVRHKSSRDDLARFNGRAGKDEKHVVLIGGGALGSQLMFNAVRAGVGRWTVIDGDRVLPHNLARHALDGWALGFPKATSLAAYANKLADEPPVHTSIDTDVIAPGTHGDEIQSAIEQANIVVDCSASVTVARHLARNIANGPRRVSVFLNPAGTDLTVLAEDEQRMIPLDALEMQYYRAVAGQTELAGALVHSQARVRYGRSCRDVSVTLPQAQVALFAGVGALAVERLLSDARARIRVWRLDPVSLSTVAVEIPVAPMRRAMVRGWEIVTDETVLRKLAELRVSRLPRETGGVVVGTYDLSRKIAYIVDVIGSPSDSEELPTSYIRGVAGLSDAVDRIVEATGGELHYIGEWHSHPQGNACLPSKQDRNLFEWISEELSRDNLPGLMLIVGDDGLAVPYLEQLGAATVYPAELRPEVDNGPAPAAT